MRVCRGIPDACCRVCDNGQPLSEYLVRRLFAAPVASAHGFGVGLYQAARQAEANGYRLLLTSNVKGKVCFELRPVRYGSFPAATIRLSTIVCGTHATRSSNSPPGAPGAVACERLMKSVHSAAVAQ